MNEWMQELKKDNFLDIAKEERGEEIVKEAKLGGENFNEGNIIQFQLKRIRDKNTTPLWLFGVVRGTKVISAGGQYYIGEHILVAQVVSPKPWGIFKYLKKPSDNLKTMDVAITQKSNKK